MDQLIFASLSRTHCWYEMGMLKVPAVYIYIETYIASLLLRESNRVAELKCYNRRLYIPVQYSVVYNSGT